MKFNFIPIKIYIYSTKLESDARREKSQSFNFVRESLFYFSLVNSFEYLSNFVSISFMACPLGKVRFTYLNFVLYLNTFCQTKIV